MPADAVQEPLGGGAEFAGEHPVGGHDDVIAGQQRGGEVSAAVGAMVQCDPQLRGLLPHLVHPLRRLIRQDTSKFKLPPNQAAHI